MTRPCKGCDGTGWIPTEDTWRIVRCGACLDSPGVVEERIPAADALADAETLRMVSLSLRNTRARSAAGQAIYNAQANGNAARFQMTTNESWVPGPEWSGRLAAHAANSAFRAVPGLRGDAC